MTYRNYFILLISSLIFTMCGEERIVNEMEMALDCQGEIDMGSFDLLDGSKELFPYPTEEITIVFSDSLGNEIAGTTSGTSLRYAGILGFDIMCLEDTSALVNVKAETESMSTLVAIPDIDVEFNIHYRVVPFLPKYADEQVVDIANITTKRLSFDDPDFIYPTPQMVIVLDERTRLVGPIGAAMPEPFVYINANKFLDVFTNTTGKDVIEIYYNYHQGIVGFRDMATGVLYGFERFE